MPEIPDLLRSWSSELDSVVDRARLLLGSAHWLTVGTFKEEIIKRWMARFLPRNVRIGSGFICPRDENSSPSKQLDILLASSDQHPFWLEEGDLFFVPPEAYLAHVEVKSTFDSRAKKSAMINVASAFRLLRNSGNPRQLWAGIYAFSAGSKFDLTQTKVEGLMKDLCDHAVSYCENIGDYCISVAIHNQVIARVSRDGHRIQAQGYIVNEYVSSFFLSDVLENLPGEAGHLSSLTTYLGQMQAKPYVYGCDIL